MNGDAKVFQHKPDLPHLNERSQGTLKEHLGIEFTAIGDNWIEARMPVDHRTIQPFGLLHGGASVALAETLGSVASVLSIDGQTQMAVGLEINANHIRSARSGFVTGRVEPLHIGRSTHVWEIKIRDEADKLICVSRITVAIIEKRST
ncbi:MAG: hotdog fold thioesterase [Bdellovibrionaceae bacterium]|nr:hotdog fold thioesterase [Pseudobdellovibrionaceae bacterium]